MKTGYHFGFLCVLIVTWGCDGGKEGLPGTIGPRVTETTGYEIPLANVTAPVVIPVDERTFPKFPAGAPVVVPANSRARLAGLPTIVPVGSPHVCTPGQDTFMLPMTITAIEEKVASGTPQIIDAKDMAIKGEGQVHFSYFGLLQGLKRSHANCIVQDRLGNLWFGYYTGITKYDGKTFTHFTLSQTAKHYSVTAMFQDRDDNLWFGTNGDGIYKYDGSSFTHFRIAQGTANDNIVYSIAQDRNGNLWFGTSKEGVYKYESIDCQGSFTRYSQAQGLGHHFVRSILLDTNGALWFGTNNGVSRYDGKSFSNFSTTQGLPSNNVSCILEDKHNHLWIGTASGVVKYDGNRVAAGQATFSIFTEAHGLASNSVSTIVEDKEGSLWFGTSADGLSKYNGNHVATGATFTNFTEVQGLAGNMLLSSIRDREGNLWFLTSRGITKYHGNIFTHLSKAQGLPGSNVISLLEDKKGYLWIGTGRGGLCRYTLPGSSEPEEFHHYGIEQGLPSMHIVYIMQDRDENIWFGTSAGVCKYEPSRDGQKATFTHFSTAQGLPNNYVMVILQDRAGNMWFGTSGGAVKYDGKSFTIFTKAQGVPDREVNNIFEDRDGNIWFGTVTSGVLRYDGTHFTHFSEREGLSNNVINGILQDKVGNIWIATREGISVYDGKSMHNFTQAQGLVYNDVTSILLDYVGNIWFGTSFGLSCLPSGTGPFDNFDKTIAESGKVMFRNYTYEDGLLGVGCNSRSILATNDGKVWFGSTDLLTVYNPEQDLPDTVAPNIQLTGLELFNEHIAWPILDAHRDSSFLLGNGVTLTHLRFDSLCKWHSVPVNLRLPHDNNFLTFRFVGVTTTQPQKVKYQYMLEGVDKYWSAPTWNSYAPYGNLSPGDYTFRVKAMSGRGHWSDALSYSFEIRPPWWKTWWAYGIYSCMILFIGWRVHDFQKVRTLRKEREKTQARELQQAKEIESAYLELGIAHETLKSTQAHLIQSEKMASLGQLTAGIAHEIQNPLNFVNNFSEINVDLIHDLQQEMRKGNLDEADAIAGDIKVNAGKIRHHGKRADAIVKSMLQHSRVSSGQHAPTDINALCDEYLRLAYHGLRAKDKSFMARLETDFDPALPEIYVVPEDIGRVMLNVINNAFYAVDEKAKHQGAGYHPQVTVSTRHRGDTVELRVTDNGNGIPATVKEKIFQPFFTTKPTGKGSGLGLSLSYEIVKAHGGELRVESPPNAYRPARQGQSGKEGKGSEFIIQLPCVTRP